MRAAISSPSPSRRAAAFTLSLAAAVAGILVPPLPLIRRGAWCLALAAGLLWLAALYVFFAQFAGPGLLAHLGLWILALVGMAAPRHLARLEAQIRRLDGKRPRA